MAQELKELCQLLFPDSAEENAEYFSEITDYIKKLGSQNWDHIRKEPERLNEEMKQLTEQTQELAFTNYKTFVETAEISHTIINDLAKSKESLSSFLDNTPIFLQECDKFSQVAGNIIKEKSRYSTIRNQSDKLLELLELPSLMREALNAEDYESALDIFTFVRNLSKRYSEIPVVQILGYLRRANTVYRSTDEDESSLYSGSNKNTVSADASERLLRRIIELHRIHLFNVLTQHKSIFLSDSQEAKIRDDELSGTSALSCWLKLKVETLAKILNQDLPKEDEASFESLLNQCMYLCLSFGRVGADMRCVLTPLFRNNILMQFHGGLEKADNLFETQMRTYKVPSIKNVPRPINESATTGPPENLLDYYPLAEYCNGMLSVLNSMRVTAPLNIVKEVYNAFRESFNKAVQVLLTFYYREQQSFTDIEKQNFVSLCVCFTEDLVPYIGKCLAQSFPSTQVAELLGVTLTVLQESNILHIDQNAVCEPLNFITGVVVN
ncbi:hypothetical protein HF086_007879 [Spodoptera exigua]|uniref:Conserved oligomeric Golgi complex subunit 8 n=1 Tax=Spodoptera exigua TaxID=7107 RepID=A0A922SPA1_SPOEX|nr:hypothetical protein HF086_007879 [Spodoptera exigua]